MGARLDDEEHFEPLFAAIAKEERERRARTRRRLVACLIAALVLAALAVVLRAL